MIVHGVLLWSFYPIYRKVLGRHDGLMVRHLSETRVLETRSSRVFASHPLSHYHESRVRRIVIGDGGGSRT